MVYLGAASWMFFMALLGDRPRLRDHVVTLGVGLGALLAALLVAVPAAGTALGTAVPGAAHGDMVQELFVTQGAWIATAGVGIGGYALSRLGRTLRRPRQLTFEVLGMSAAAALVPASLHHLSFLLVLVPGAVAGVAATLLEEVSRPVAVLAGLLGTLVFVAVFLGARAFPVLGLPELLLGTAGLAYALGRWTDLHPASMQRPGPLLWAALACGFVLAYLA
jgi:hypothetical protein